MAQRMIHYLLGELISEGIALKDKNRFLLGSIMPDGFTDVSMRDVTHFVTSFPEKDGRGWVRYYDFERFRREYKEQMAADDLYFGYYMHIVEDDCYRNFIRKDLRLNLYSDPASVEKLHRDYHLLNSYIRGKYSLKDLPAMPADIGSLPLCRIAGFDMEKLIDDMCRDFTEEAEGEFTFITPKILNDFMKRYLWMILREAESAYRDEVFLRARDFSWISKNPGNSGQNIKTEGEIK